MAPRIDAPSIPEQRELRQRQLIDAALSLALESGAEAVTVTAVATRAGLSRTTFYEYFSSSADLIADLVMEELATYQERLLSAVKGSTDSIEYIEAWIAEALHYVADGRHLLAKSLSATDLPKDRGSEIAMAHRKLLAPLHASLASLGVKDISQALSLLQAATDVATKRIESARVDSQYDAEAEIARTTAFCIAGISALV